MIVSCLTFLGVGLSYINIDITHETYKGIVKESKDNYFIFSCGLDKYYVKNYSNEYEVGDILEIKGDKEKIDFVTLESDFDFESYLYKKGINYELNATYIKEVFLFPLRINQYKKSFLSRFDNDTSSLVGSLLFSYNTYDSDVYNNASKLHLLRLTSASGIYIYLYLKIVKTLLSLKLDEKKSELGSIIFLFPYLLFTFPKFSVIRILSLSLTRWINKYKFDKRIDNLSLIALNGLFFLFLDYHLASQDSFLLGYSIPLFIHFINNLKTTKKRIKSKIILSFSLFIFFIPFEISYYNQINLLSFLYQFLYSPLFIVYAFFSFLCFLHIPLYGMMNFLTKIIGTLLSISIKLNPTIYMKNNEAFVVIFYILLFAFLYYYSIGFKKIYKSALTLSLVLSTLYIIPINTLITTEVSFLNVGQGDSCLIRKGETAIMIDTGGNIYKDIATSVLIPYLKKKQIYKLDLLITTHDDYDHSGAKESLMENFKVQSYISDPYSFPLTIDGICLTNYNYVADSDEENENSLVIGFNLSNTNYLIMGDAPKIIENEIMANYSSIPCDILKVGHHGSNTSTGEEFLKFVSPKEAVISCGKNNKYGHPHQEVVSLLNKYNITIRRTDEEGTISYINYIFM